MGKFLCRCGNAISDSIYPCQLTGELRWETETESQSEDRSADIKDFLLAVDRREAKTWIKNYFNEGYPEDLEVYKVIEDITSRVEGKSGRCVYRCPKCERMYIQKEFNTDDWTCYEKAE